jgi:hypothetical protein
MKALVFLAFIALACAIPSSFKQCLSSAATLKDSFLKALESQDIDQIIDDAEKVF